MYQHAFGYMHGAIVHQFWCDRNTCIIVVVAHMQKPWKIYIRLLALLPVSKVTPRAAQLCVCAESWLQAIFGVFDV